MNTVARFETALIEQFQRTGFPPDAPMQVCFERDAERHAWHVVAKRLGAFSLHHRHPDVERHLFFDEQKNIYIRCRPNFHGFSQRAREVISRALRRCRAKNGRANGRIFYKKSARRTPALSWSRLRSCSRSVGKRSAPRAWCPCELPRAAAAPACHNFQTCFLETMP